jgi:hypothetical protein
LVCLCRTETNGCYPGYDATEWKKKATEPPQKPAANDAQGSEATADPEAPRPTEAPTGYYKRKVKPTWWFSEAIGSELDSRGHLPQISSFLCSYTWFGIAVRVLVPQIYLNIFAAAEVSIICTGSRTRAAPYTMLELWLGPRLT